MTELNTSTVDKSGAGAMRAVFFWHGWSALMIAPVLLVLLLTGSAYLFDREFDQWWQQDALELTPEGTAATLAQQQDFTPAVSGLDHQQGGVTTTICSRSALATDSI